MNNVGNRVHLSDLLGYGDPGWRPRNQRSLLRRSVSRFAVMLAILTVGWWLARTQGLGIPYPLVLGVVSALVLLRGLLDRVAPQPLPPVLHRYLPPSGPRIRLDDGIRTAARRWESRIEWMHDDPARFAATVQPAVADLVSERLRMRHSISLADDPERARQVVGAALWAFIHQPVRRTVKPQDLAAVVAQLEEL